MRLERRIDRLKPLLIGRYGHGAATMLRELSAIHAAQCEVLTAARDLETNLERTEVEEEEFTAIRMEMQFGGLRGVP